MTAGEDQGAMGKHRQKINPGHHRKLPEDLIFKVRELELVSVTEEMYQYPFVLPP